MHAVFIPYGKKECVDVFLRDIAAQKYELPIHSPDGKETKEIIIEGQLRILPFGVYEHVFPREQMDKVLTTLGFHTFTGDHTYKGDKAINKKYLALLRLILGAKKPPEFKTDIKIPWKQEFVAVIPIGFREDRDIKDPTEGPYKGWTHEGI